MAETLNAPEALTVDSSRRQFCQAAALGLLSVLAQSCGGNPSGPTSSSALTVLTGTAGAGVVTLPVDSSSPLATVGNAAIVQAGSTVLLVARTAQDAFVAVSSVCTHQACQITNYTGSAYVCVCHGSQFSTSGQVLTGPASTSLRSYATQFASSVLTITL